MFSIERNTITRKANNETLHLCSCSLNVFSLNYLLKQGTGSKFHIFWIKKWNKSNVILTLFFLLFSSHASFFFVSSGHAYLSSFVFFSFPSFIGFYSVRLGWIWLLKIKRFIEKIQFFFMITKLSVCLFSFSFQNIPFLLHEIMICIIHRYR